MWHLCLRVINFRWAVSFAVPVAYILPPLKDDPLRRHQQVFCLNGNNLARGWTVGHIRVCFHVLSFFNDQLICGTVGSKALHGHRLSVKDGKVALSEKIFKQRTDSTV